MTPLMRRVLASVSAVALAVTLSACAAPDAATQAYLDGQNSGYIGGDGTVMEIAEDQRGEPVDFGGIDQTGAEIDGAALRGDVVVVNFWYAACGPCRVEAKDLEEVYVETKDSGVHFVGVNTSDLADTAVSFMEDYGVTYPSIMDVETGEAKFAFARATPIQATPTTLVLDKDGRVAARIIGALDGPSILKTIVTELQATQS